MLLAATTALLLAFAPVPLATPRGSSSRTAAPTCLDDQTIALIAGGVTAATAGLGAFFVSTKKPAAPPAPPAAAPQATPPPKPSKKQWKSLGGSSGPHRGAGRWTPPPPAELWVPPPGWKPPTKPVSSWYDSGLRLAPETASKATVSEATAAWSLTSIVGSIKNAFKGATAKASGLRRWKNLGGSSGYHRMAGRWPPPDPTPSQTAAAKTAIKTATAKTAAAASSVKSWYDAGRRLTPPKPAVASWYDSGKRL
tara:strand:- start:510 stop:1268 length:759 start_codon:yes stop_codon:yes gene_type:complete